MASHQAKNKTKTLYVGLQRTTWLDIPPWHPLDLPSWLCFNHVVYKCTQLFPTSGPLHWRLLLPKSLRTLPPTPPSSLSWLLLGFQHFATNRVLWTSQSLSISSHSSIVHMFITSFYMYCLVLSISLHKKTKPMKVQGPWQLNLKLCFQNLG